MFFFKEVLVLLWCVTFSQAVCSNATICVASGKNCEADCQQHHIIHSLSDLTINETSCKTVHIYFTSGTHFLSRNLYFSDSVEETQIHGATHGKPSIIECRNARIRFSENGTINRVSISNVAFLCCQDPTILAALFFKHAQYTLNNVAVRNTEGYGLYAEQCYEQVIFNCTFTNNTYGNIQFVLQNSRTQMKLDFVKITINQTKIHEGTSGINATILDRVRSNFSIFNCEFFRNKHTHLLIVSKSTEVVNLRIESSVLITSNGFGVVVRSNGTESEIIVTLQNSTFKHNEKGGILFGCVTRAKITNCTSANNNDDGIWIDGASKLVIIDSLVNNNTGTGLVILRSTSIETEITNCTFANNSDSGIWIEGASKLVVIDSLVNNNAGTGSVIKSTRSAEITKCTFANNNDDGIWIGYSNYTKFVIVDCLVNNNIGTGLVIYTQISNKIMGMETEISKINFFNNSRALDISFPVLLLGHETKISECRFTKHRISTEKAVVMIKSLVRNDAEPIILHNSSFVGNEGFHGDCSALLVKGMDIIINSVNIADNNCTGITLYRSTMALENVVNFTRNHGLQGGALALKGNSLLTFTNSSDLNIINNTADTYGGGIYSDAICDDADVDVKGWNCFFQFQADYIPMKNIFSFSGNSAIQGGDAIYGSCLSNCFIDSNAGIVNINKIDPNNIFWDLVSTMNIQSPSTFVEHPKSVAFCTHSSKFGDENVYCTKSYEVSAHRGQVFTVPLIVTDGFCYPSVEIIEAKVFQGSERMSTVQLERGFLQKAKKSCHNFSYAVKGGLEKQTAMITFNLQQQLIQPVTLTVHLKDCPKAYEINSDGQCGCLNILKSYNVECNSSHYSLSVPAQTWVGELRDGSIAMQKNCQYCSNGESKLTNIVQDSDELCTVNRHGTMCGACSHNSSLQLGGYECTDCSNSTQKGIMLVIAFALVGIALVLLLLGLNLTVSTGMINGLIFYSNIVYLNSDALLPISSEGKGTHLQNLVQFLSSFQSWMNLDFGIITCFFDGYDTYISTWMQFIFPLYIWLLILIIVLSSRYSSRISKITTSNTVSVLATLLLLAYAKLLKTCIEAFSSVRLQLLDGNFSHMLWKSDANISYLGRLHVPLFLMSLVMVVVYAIPFTLLILLGPLLQAKSHLRFLSWINKLKPFLDSFYGPYTSKYRYWPGILLLIRLVILFTFAFYSPNDTLFKFTAVSTMIAVLLATWFAIGKIQAVSIHEKSSLNFLELFLHLNLGIFTIASAYAAESTNGLKHQQGLAVVMVGSVLAVFCGILAYQIFCTASRYKATHKIIQFVTTKMKRREIAENVPTQKSSDVSDKTTHSVVEMAERTNELREPLLTNS